jgi:hypothetical protein
MGGVGRESKYLLLDARNIFARSHTEHHSHLFAVPILVLWVGLEEKGNIFSWIREIFFARSHTEHHWMCSKRLGELLMD